MKLKPPTIPQQLQHIHQLLHIILKGQCFILDFLRESHSGDDPVKIAELSEKVRAETAAMKAAIDANQGE